MGVESNEKEIQAKNMQEIRKSQAEKQTCEYEETQAGKAD